MTHDAYVRPYTAIKINDEWEDITSDTFGHDGKSGIGIVHGQANQTSRISYGLCDSVLNNGNNRYSPRNPNSDLFGSLNRNIAFRAGVDKVVMNFSTPVADSWGSTDANLPGPPVPGVPWTLDGTSTAFDVASGVGTIVSTGTSSKRVAYIESYGEAEVLIKFKISSLTTDPTFGLVFQYKDSTEYYAITVDTISSDFIYLESQIDGSGSSFNNIAITAIVADTYYWMHASFGQRIRVNFWADSAAERTDGEWDYDIYDDDILNFGRLARHGGVGPFIANGTNTTVLTVDYFEVFNPRFYGEISSYIPDADKSNSYKFTGLQASGILRRLRVGEQANLVSTFYRASVKESTLQYALGYWPCEDTSGAQAPSSGLSGGSPMVCAVIPQFGNAVGIPGSAPLMTMSSGGGVSALLPATPDTTGGIYYRMVMIPPTTEIADLSIICHIHTTGSAAQYRLIYHTGGSLRLAAYNGAGTLLDDTAIITFGVTPGSYFNFSIELVQDGADVDSLIVVNKISAEGNSLTSSLFADTFPGLNLGKAFKIDVSFNGSIAGAGVGHIGIGNNQQFMFASNAIIGYSGETAAERMSRLCDENGLDFYLVGNAIDTTLVGAQQIATLETNLQLAADTDQGILFEPRTSLSIGYVTRTALYDQRAIEVDYSASYLDDQLRPNEDDVLIANDVTATSATGGSSRYVVDSGPNNNQAPPDGVGVYHANPPLTVLTHDKADLPSIAAMRAFIGTWDEARFPTVSVNYMRSQLKTNNNLRAQVLSLSEGTYLKITNPPEWLPPEDIHLMTFGYKEIIGQLMNTSIFNTVPYGPYLIGIVGENTFRAAGGEDIVLLSSVTTSETKMIVASASGTQKWATTTDDAESSADFPMDAMIGGERVTITAVSGNVTDPFTRSVSNGWGSEPVSGVAYVNSGGSASDFNVSGTTATQSNTSVNTIRNSLLNIGSPDVDFKVDVSVPVANAAGASITQWIAARAQDINNYYVARLDLSTGGVTTLALYRRVAGTLTGPLVTAVTVGTAHAANEVWRVRFSVIGSTLKARAWLASGSEPITWHFSTTDTNLTTGSNIGLLSRLETGNTNTLPVVFTWDNLTTIIPQALTTTRSVNGIVKAHSASDSIDVVERSYVGR